MSKLVLVPFSADETATAQCFPICDYIEGQTMITKDQVIALFKMDAHKGEIHPDDMKLIEAFDPNDTDELSEAHTEMAALSYTHMAVVDEIHLPKLNKLSVEALSHNGGDSELYEACADYNESLVDIAEKVIPMWFEE